MTANFKLFTLICLFGFLSMPIKAIAQPPKHMSRVIGAFFEPMVWFSKDSISAFCPCFAPVEANGGWKQVNDSDYLLKVQYEKRLSQSIYKVDTLAFLNDSFVLEFVNSKGEPIIDAKVWQPVTAHKDNITNRKVEFGFDTINLDKN